MKINKECIYTRYQVWVTAMLSSSSVNSLTKKQIVGACDIFKIFCFCASTNNFTAIIKEFKERKKNHFTLIWMT